MNNETALASHEVSVVIPHYGDPVHAQHLVAELRRQRGGRELEIIVADDCSPQSFPASEDAIVFRCEENGGFGSAVNAGAKLVTRTYLLILNSDLDLTENFVENLMAAAKPWMPAVVAPALVNDDGEPQWSGRHFPRARHYVAEWLRPLARWRHRRILHEAVGHDTRCVPGATLPTDWLVGAVLLMPTELFHRERGFDERFYMYCEETDLQRRLRKRRIPSVYLGEIQVKHAGGASTDSRKRLGWLLASRFYYAQKWRSGATRMRAGLWIASALNLVFGGVRRLLGRDERPLVTLRNELSVVNESWRESQSRVSTARLAAE